MKKPPRILLFLLTLIATFALAADLKISQLPDGGTVQATDQIPVNRSGTTTRVTVGDLATLDALTKADIGLSAVENTALSTWAGSGSLTTGAGGTFGTAAYTDASAYEVPLTFSTGLQRTGDTISSTVSKSSLGLGNVENTALSTWAGSSNLTTGAGGTFGTAAYTATGAYEVPVTFSTGLTRTTNTVTVNTSQNVATLSNLTSNGFVQTSGGTGALSIASSIPFGSGGTGLTSASDDTAMVSSGSAWVAKTLPDCGATASALQYTQSSNSFGCGTHEVPVTFSTGLTRTTNTVTVNTSQNIATLSNLTSNGFVTTTGGTGALSITATPLPFGSGGTNLATAADDATLVSSGSAWVAAVLPTCNDTTGKHLNYSISTNSFSCGTTVLGNGPTNAIQYNAAGAAGGDAGLLYNATTDTVTIAGAIISAGTKFTASGCSNGTTVGGATAGRFTSGTTGACTVVITLPTATTGWACAASNETTANLMRQSADSTTSCTVTGTTVTGDVVVFSAIAF